MLPADCAQLECGPRASPALRAQIRGEISHNQRDSKVSPTQRLAVQMAKSGPLHTLALGFNNVDIACKMLASLWADSSSIPDFCLHHGED